MLRTEISFLLENKHQHIIKIEGSYEIVDGNRIGMLMTPVADCDLRTYLDSAEPCTFKQRALLAEGIGCLAAALAYIHARNELHNDISPSNILVSGGKLLFSDFGIARNIYPTSATNESKWGPYVSVNRKVLVQRPLLENHY
jgi:serine/threonine protein kinase